MINYQITPADLNGHLFDVKLTLTQASPNQQFWLPSWLPGSYMIRDFCRNIIDIKATDETGKSVEIEQIDKQTWQTNTASQTVNITYRVYAWDLSVRSAHLDQTHGFFNGSSVFLAVKEQESQSVTLDILPPATKPQWQIATTLTQVEGELWQFGRFSAENYAELIDHPVEMGEFTHGRFFANGIPHDVVLTGPHRCDIERLLADLKPICEHQINLFGEAPFSRYLFLTHVLGEGFGGLEHRSSTALHCSRSDLPHSKMTNPSKGYQVYLSLCSHEYFHSWNVKRIKPVAFTPYKLTEESYTPQLWAYEGITSYYDDLITYLAGTVSIQQYLDTLAQTMTRVYRSQGRMLQTLTESSFNAWTKFYKQDENANNAIVSYYTKGALFALYLDLVLRLETKGKYNLTHLMQRLWQEFGATGIGTNDDSHQQIYAKLLGRDATAEFAYLDNKDDIPLAPLLEQFGVGMILRSSAGSQDTGGIKKQGFDIEFGAKYKIENAGLRIISVRLGSPAHAAGLSAQDLLIAADNLKISAQFEVELQKYKLNDIIKLHFFRRDELISGDLVISEAPKDTVTLTLIDAEKAKAWLS